MLRIYAVIAMWKNTSPIKIGFSLKRTKDWPPFDVEHVWVEPSEGSLRIKNFPFFVQGLAFDDEITAVLDENNYVQSWKMKNESPNSTIWVWTHSKTDIIGKLEKLGCGVEGSAVEGLFSVNVPPSVRKDQIEGILDKYEGSSSVSIAFPAYRLDK